MSKDRESVRVLTVENWRTSRRARRSAGIIMGVWIEELPDGRFRTHYGGRGYGAVREWGTIEEALEYANRDEGGVHIFFGDVPPGAPVETTYDADTDTTTVHAPDLHPRHLTGGEETPS